MSKDFRILNGTITITDERKNYCHLRALFDHYGNQARSSFKNFYLNDISSLDGFLDNAVDVIVKIYKNIGEKALEYLSHFDIYQYDSSDFLNYMGKNSHFLEYYHELDEFRASLIKDQEEQKRYRAARKQARGRWQGGGFGLTNAMIGAATAGAMNTVTGIGHSAVNLIGNAFTSLSVSSQKSSVYHDKKTQKKLFDAVYTDIFELHYLLASLINDNTKLSLDVILPEDEKKASTLLNNIQKLDLPTEKAQRLLIQALNLNPFSSSIYQYIFNYFPDDMESCFSLTDYITANNALSFLSEELAKYYSTLSSDTEEQALQTKELLLQRMKQYHMSSSQELDDINKKLEAFDLAARTYKGVEYPTREARNKVEADINSLLNQISELGSINSKNIKSWNQLKSTLNSGNYEKQTVEIISNKIEEKIKERLHAIDQQLNKDLTNGQLDELYEELAQSDIDSKTQESYFEKIANKKKENDQNVELSQYKKIFENCDPTDPQTRQYLSDLIESSYPLLSSKLKKQLTLFTQDNIIAISNFTAPQIHHRLKFHFLYLILAVVAFILIFVFLGLLSIVFGILCIYFISKIFEIDTYLAEKDQKMIDLISDLTLNGRIIHPYVRKWMELNDWDKYRQYTHFDLPNIQVIMNDYKDREDGSLK